MGAVKSELQAFYTKSDDIVSYMVEQLQLKDGDSVLEPCAGDGVFVDAIRNLDKQVRITVWEINKNEVDYMQKKYADTSNVDVYHKDALLDSVHNLFYQPETYDRIIANPPYGAWQNYDRRDLLKTIYPQMYVRETYGLFLYQSINLLSPDGRLVFIVPDTFMHLHLHRNLRKHILQKSEVERIVVFPSNFFPGISFGYANLCIITLKRINCREVSSSHSIEIITGLQQPSDLSKIDKCCTGFKRFSVKQTDLMRDHNMQFPINLDLPRNYSRDEITIGDISDVVTGFYSGDDKSFLRRASCVNRERYDVIDASLIAGSEELNTRPIGGIEGPRCFVPIVKGGAVQYVKLDHWFMDWSKESVHKYKNVSKKARFQNSAFYFREGIAVPMVKSSKMTAALIEKRLFDQSIVGVFPHEAQMVWYLLAFFNSPTCNRFIQAINPTANNSANYIKRIPIRLPSSEQRSRIDLLTVGIVERLKASGSFDKRDEVELHKIIEQIHCDYDY